MGEFLTNNWDAGDANFPAVVIGIASSARSSDDAAEKPPGRQNGLSRQWSFTRLSGKTAEEFLPEIQRGEQVDHNHDKHGGNSGGGRGRWRTF